MQLSPQQNQLLVKIKEILGKSDTIVFVGSGISRWSGLPSWYGMIEELANFLDSQGESSEIVRKELKTNDLLQAASYGLDLLTKPQIAEFFRLACRVDTASPHEIHKEIISLGPSCYLTTNYDQLLEHSFSKWHIDKHPRVVTNNQLTETANIIQARSSNFIFKPHGDINDSESIILTREHYRKLSGEKQSVLRALETLLASRPVVFLGFGLRDLDFLYVKDTLANIYKGGTIDHYAIMPDVSEQERTYWRKNFGIHILPYATSPEASGHQQLLDILQRLNKRGKENVVEIGANKNLGMEFSPERILAIARYSANIIHSASMQNESHVPLRISPKRGDKNDHFVNYQDSFAHTEVERFLAEYPHNALLIGNPGAGKSYSLRRVLHKLAQVLQTNCLQNSFQMDSLVFPIYLDLKLYEGDIFEMINQNLPPDFPLEQLSGFNKIRFYLDSYNELPSKYVDSGEFQNELVKLLSNFKNSVTIIASRFEEGLTNLDYPVYQIDNVDYKFISDQLEKLEFELPDRFRGEIINLLQKPLFFRLYQEQKITLVRDMTPVDVYKSFVGRMSSELSDKYNANISLEEMLKQLAFDMLNNGIETFTSDSLVSVLNDYFSKENLTSIRPVDVVNWLISRNFIVPASNLRLSFFHQSLTEYLAALMLVERYKETPSILADILKYTRWDQCLFLALGFLTEDESNNFIQKIMTADFSLSIKAAKYLEHKRDDLISQILTICIDSTKQHSGQFEYGDAWALAQLPVTKYHERLLYDLLELHGNIGGAASRLLVDILGKDVKDFLIKEMFSHPNDFNYCRDVGGSLSRIIDFNDFQIIFNKVGDIEIDELSDDTYSGFFYGLEQSVANISEADLLGIFREWREYNSAQVGLICEILDHMRVSNEGIKILIDIVISGHIKAVFPLYLRTAYPEDEYPVDWSLYSLELIEKLVENLDKEEIGDWSLSCISLITKERKDVLDFINMIISDLNGVKKIALLTCIPDSKDFLWQELETFSDLLPTFIDKEPIFLFNQIDINWRGKENIFIKLLQTYNLDLIYGLLEYLFMDGMEISEKGDSPLPNLDVEPITWWLEWMNNIAKKQGDDNKIWFILNRIGIILPKCVDKKYRRLIIDEFNQPNSSYRILIKDFLLSSISEMSLDLLTEETIQFLITDLNNKQNHSTFRLGAIATEQFAEKRLVPLLADTEEPFHSNLIEAIDAAGRKNNRRFLVE